MLPSPSCLWLVKIFYTFPHLPPFVRLSPLNFVFHKWFKDIVTKCVPRFGSFVVLKGQLLFESNINFSAIRSEQNTLLLCTYWALTMTCFTETRREEVIFKTEISLSVDRPYSILTKYIEIIQVHSLPGYLWYSFRKNLIIAQKHLTIWGVFVCVFVRVCVCVYVCGRGRHLNVDSIVWEII